MEALRKRSAKRKREGPGSVRDTIEKWKKLAEVIEQCDISSREQEVGKMAAKGSRKGCMKRKGGPENSTCKFRGCRQRVCGKWDAEIREPNGGKRLWLGTFNSDIKAASGYYEAVRSMYGNRARLSFGCFE